MPLYEYMCKSCGNKLEEFQDINDDPLIVCPACSGPLKRLISTGFISVEYNAQEALEKEIKPEAKRIAERIKAGDEEAAADFFGVDE